MDSPDLRNRPSALWVLAHPRRTSFNARLLRAGAAELARTHDVVVSDLYADGFDPVLGDRDLGEPAGRPGNIVDLSTEASERGELPGDVVREQGRVAAAELIVLQFPLWWYGVPAILKGWFDRVFTNGFAYGGTDAASGLPLRYGDGPLAGKRALIIVTAGEDPRSIGERGISGDLDSLLFPLTHGTLWYTGIASLPLHIVHDADALDRAGIDRETERLRRRIAGISGESPRLYRRLGDGDYRGTRALRGDILPGRTDLGIHLAEAE